MAKRVVGVIGGSGLYEMEGLERVEEIRVSTVFGDPSDVVVSGWLGETRMLFLPRHGRGHRFPPHRINYRANLLALKQLGAEQVISVSAVGSMKEHIHPGEMVLVDQFIDRTPADRTDQQRRRRRAPRRVERMRARHDEPGPLVHAGAADHGDQRRNAGRRRRAHRSFTA